MKNIVRVLIREFLFFVNLFLPKKAMPFILMYHSISDMNDYFCVTNDSFKWQMDFLKKRFNTLSFNDFLEQMTNPSENIVTITFDDGYKDNLENAYPYMNKLSIPGTVYVPIDFIGKNEKYEYLTREELVDTYNLGIEIGGHGVSHRSLNQIKDSEVASEIMGSKEGFRLKEVNEIKHFAYPSGKYNSTVIDELRKNGFKSAVTVEPGPVLNQSNIFELPRIDINRYTTKRDFKLRFTRAYALFPLKRYLR